MNSRLFLFFLISSLGFHLVFVDKAFHIDDPLFLYAARQILETPRDPFSSEIDWNGEERRMADFFSNPPGMSYYLAFLISAFGEKEWVLHLFLWPFTLCSLIFFYYISQRFTDLPLRSSLVLLASPIFLVTATNLMPDIPLLCFSLGGIYFYITGHDERKTEYTLISGVFFGLAILLRYNAIILPFLMIMYSFLKRSGNGTLHLIPLLIPISVFIIWNIYSDSLYGYPHFFAQFGFQSAQADFGTFLENLTANLTYLSCGTGFFAVIAAFNLIKDKGGWLILSLVAMISFIFYFIFGHFFAYNILHRVMATLLILSALLILAYSAFRIFKTSKWLHSDDLFLLLWIVGGLVMHLTGIHTASKYVLLILPPFILLLIKNFQIKYFNISFGASLLFGLLISFADYKSANVYRQTSKMVSIEYPSQDGYFNGHWGFQYYLEKAGLESKSVMEKNLKDSTIFVTTSLAWPRPISPPLPDQFDLTQEIVLDSEWPLKTMHNHRGKHANFYSNTVFPNHKGVLLFSISTYPLDTIKIYRLYNSNN